MPEVPELRSIDLGGPIAYRMWEGPEESTFVLIHGLGASHLSWVQAAPGLAGLGRVFALDLPGFGYSPRAGRNTALMDLRRALSRFVSKFASGRVVLCGNSMGGAISILQAAVEPESVAGIVLTDSVFPRARGSLPHPAVLASFAVYDTPFLGEWLVRARMQRLSPEHTVEIGFRICAANPRTIPDEIVRMHEDLVRARSRDQDAPGAFVAAARSMLRLGKNPDAIARAMDGVRCPVLVLHGRRDVLVPARFAEAAVASHPRWRAHFFPDLGHIPQMEAPGRWLAEVADWHAKQVG